MQKTACAVDAGDWTAASECGEALKKLIGERVRRLMLSN
jgi:hypothetical protein